MCVFWCGESAIAAFCSGLSANVGQAGACIYQGTTAIHGLEEFAASRAPEGEVRATSGDEVIASAIALIVNQIPQRFACRVKVAAHI